MQTCRLSATCRHFSSVTFCLDDLRWEKLKIHNKLSFRYVKGSYVRTFFFCISTVDIPWIYNWQKEKNHYMLFFMRETFFFCQARKWHFSNFSCMFLNPNIFSNLNSNCANLSDIRNLQEQVKKSILLHLPLHSGRA